MADHNIVPDRVTKPIQLLAAWLTGLVLIDGAFLGSAAIITNPSWLAAVLVIAAVANVPLFIGALFLLQTRFRPEMQEDSFYSQYLETKYSSSITPNAKIDIQESSRELAEQIVKKLGPKLVGRREPIEKVIAKDQFEKLVAQHAGLRTLSELFLRPKLWDRLVDRFYDSPKFKHELDSLLRDRLIEMDAGVPSSTKLTSLGKKVARAASSQGILFGQIYGHLWKTMETNLKEYRSTSR